jgi:UDP-N-acetylmuramoyl-tripeptide--D-alanyl-D-alanine ligase
MRGRTRADVVLFGESIDADVRVVELVLDDLARPTCTMVTPWGTARVSLAVSGRHMAVNAAAALACVGVAGGDVLAGAAALSSVVLTAMRMDVQRAASGAVVMNDSYNANPTSMRAAIDALVDLPARRRVAVLGLMAEISDPAEEHLALAKYAVRRGVDVIAYRTDLYGLEPVADVESAMAALGSLAGGDAVLVKGSRVVGLEHVAAALLG